MTPEPSFGEKCAEIIWQEMDNSDLLWKSDKSIMLGIAQLIDDQHAQEQLTQILSEHSDDESNMKSMPQELEEMRSMSTPTPAQPDEYDVHGKRRERWFESWNPAPSQPQGEWWEIEKDDSEPFDPVFGWWLDIGSKSRVWLEHEGIARWLKAQHNAALAAVRAERDAATQLVDKLLKANFSHPLADLQTPSLGGK